jgi:hypothetical protein
VECHDDPNVIHGAPDVLHGVPHVIHEMERKEMEEIKNFPKAAMQSGAAQVLREAEAPLPSEGALLHLRRGVDVESPRDPPPDTRKRPGFETPSSTESPGGKFLKVDEGDQQEKIMSTELALVQVERGDQELMEMLSEFESLPVVPIASQVALLAENSAELDLSQGGVRISGICIPPPPPPLPPAETPMGPAGVPEMGPASGPDLESDVDMGEGRGQVQDDFPWTLPQCYAYLDSQMGLIQSNLESIVAQEIGMLRQQVAAEKISMVEHCAKLVEDIKNARGAPGTIDEVLLQKEIDRRVRVALALMDDILDKKIVALEAKLSVDLHQGFTQLSGQLGQWQAQVVGAQKALDQKTAAALARHQQEGLLRH